MGGYRAWTTGKGNTCQCSGDKIKQRKGTERNESQGVREDVLINSQLRGWQARGYAVDMAKRNVLDTGNSKAQYLLLSTVSLSKM